MATALVGQRALLGMLALVVGVSAVGCSVVEEETAPEDDPKLIALMQDEMATYRPPGGRLLSESEQTEGASFGKPHDARIIRMFVYRSPEQAEQGRAATVRAAQASGWKLNLEGADESPIFGRKRLTTGGATLIIGWYKDESGHRVSIWLEHQPCGRGRCY